MDELIKYSPEFIQRCQQLKAEMYLRYTTISGSFTPEYDGSGNKIIETRPDNKQYVDESYMKASLNKYFPGWSWEMAAPLHFLGSEWIVAQGHLIIVDEYLVSFGIIPPIRKFYGVDSVRIQFAKDLPHTPDNIIDIGDNAMAAVSGAFKRAINRLTGIADDIYRKQINLEGAGSLDYIINHSTDPWIIKISFMSWLRNRHILDSRAFQLLGIRSYNEISDFKVAYEKIKNQL